MDLAKDIFNVAEKVGHVPGLSIACSLAFQIIETVQTSKNNSARLQSLAHIVAENLLGISENMRGRWANVPGNLKDNIDEFEAILQDVSKAVTTYSRSSRLRALVTAGDRELEITRLEKRLSDVQRTILLRLGMNTSIAVNQLQQTAASQHLIELGTQSDLRQIQLLLASHERLGLETYSGVRRLVDESESCRVAVGSPQVDETGFFTYSLDDIQVLRTLSRHHVETGSDGHIFTLVLHKAERRADGRVVLIKSYEGLRSGERDEVFSRDLAPRKHILDSSILQLVGASRSTASLPFQVYHAPGGHFEAFDDWITRTLSSNPVEALYGLYKMQTSTKDIEEFQRHQHILCDGFDSPSSWIVNVKPHGKQLEWRLTYAGNLKNNRQPTNNSWRPLYLNMSIYYNGYRYRAHDGSAHETAAAFCATSNLWYWDPQGLETILQRGLETKSLPVLASALLENGYLGACSGYVIGSSSIALGDVGHMADDGRFVVVDNLHNLLISSDGAASSWYSRQSRYPEESSQDTVVLEHSGMSYRRLRHEGQQFPSELHTHSELGYNYFDHYYAWKIMQQHACRIITDNGLSVAPHDLKLVISVRTSSFLRVKNDKAPKYHDETGPAHNVSKREFPASEPGSQASSDGTPPTIYTFEKGDGVYVRDSGAPELAMSSRRVSLEKEPHWLDDEAWEEGRGIVTKHGFCLEYTHMRSDSSWIEYLQLPVDIAHPYTMEVNDG